MTFKFGGTYKNDCDVSIGEHLHNFDQNKEKFLDVKRVSEGVPSLEAVSFDPAVRDRLNTYRDSYVGRPMMIGKYSSS